MATSPEDLDFDSPGLAVDTPQYAKSLDPDWEFPIFEKMFRIAVSGDVPVTQLELEIIDSPDFQRLQGVRQLGASVRVYPTALHTRFDHSLGTLAMVDKMIAEIREDNNKNKKDRPEEREISDIQKALARLYGLLHDIGHVPFGHTIEDELGIFTKHDSPDSPRFQKFLGKETKIGKAIRRHLAEDGYLRFCEIYTNNISDPNDLFIYDLVSNTICADLLDYALRDSYFCNLDIEMEYRFLPYLYLKNVEGREGGNGIKAIKKGKRVLIRLVKGDNNEPRRDTLTDLTRLLEMRYMIAERVYFHHTKIIAGTMITRAIQEAQREGLQDDDLCCHTDDTLVEYLSRDDSTGEVCNRLASDYKYRRLFKTIKKYAESDFSPSLNDHAVSFDDMVIGRLRKKDDRRQIENEIAEDVGAKEGEILIYPPERTMNNKVAEMLVQWRGDERLFEEIDDEMVTVRLSSILAAHQALWKIYLIGSPALDQSQRDAAEHAFERRFVHLGTTSQATKKRLESVEHVVRHNLPKEGNLVRIQPREHSDLVRETAELVLGIHATASGKRLSVREAVEFMWSEK